MSNIGPNKSYPDLMALHASAARENIAVAILAGLCSNNALEQFPPQNPDVVKNLVESSLRLADEMMAQSRPQCGDGR